MHCTIVTSQFESIDWNWPFNLHWWLKKNTSRLEVCIKTVGFSKFLSGTWTMKYKEILVKKMQHHIHFCTDIDFSDYFLRRKIKMKGLALKMREKFYGHFGFWFFLNQIILRKSNKETISHVSTINNNIMQQQFHTLKNEGLTNNCLVVNEYAPFWGFYTSCY